MGWDGCGMKWGSVLDEKRLVGALHPVNSVGLQYQKINTDFIRSVSLLAFHKSGEQRWIPAIEKVWWIFVRLRTVLRFECKPNWLHSSSYVMFMLRKLPLFRIRKDLIRIRIRLFSSVAFKMPTKIKLFFLLCFGFLLSVGTFTSFF